MTCNIAWRINARLFGGGGVCVRGVSETLTLCVLLVCVVCVWGGGVVGGGGGLTCAFIGREARD